MGSQTPGDPTLSAGRRLGAAKARAHKSARGDAKNGLASVSSISALLPDGPPAPPLTDDEIQALHPVAIGLYESLTRSEEAKHFRDTDWYSVKIIMLMVSGHLHDAATKTVVNADGTTREIQGSVKVGVLAEVNRALESINATPAGRTQYALALAALLKATGADQPDPEKEEREREVAADKATAELLRRIERAG